MPSIRRETPCPLSPARDAQAARRFFSTILDTSPTIPPRVIPVETHAASPKALRELKQEEMIPEGCQLRQKKDLTTLVEQDHRAHQTPGETRDGFLLM